MMTVMEWNELLQRYYWILILILVIVIGLIGVLLWYIRQCRRQPRYEYTALEDEAFLQDRLEMDRKMLRDADRNMAMIQCQYYLRGSSRYIFMKQLAEMGSRIGKHWFLVRDTATKTERLLTMTLASENCSVRYTSATKHVLLELFQALQHPYIYPVLDIDRKVVTEQEFVITVIPFNDKGSLKDFIYHSQCQDEWKEKYCYQGCGLQQIHIQRLGCQILVALLFLKDQGFPPFLHLHSGNVILQNGVARLSGLENVLLGYSSRQNVIIPKRILDNKDAAESLCFGHLLFEMAAGYELTTYHPTEKDYKEIENCPKLIKALKFIFEQERYHYPHLRQIASMEFFRYIDLRELQSHVPISIFHAKLSQDTQNFLKEVKRHQRGKKRNKRSQSMSTLETMSVDSRETGGSTRTVKRKKKRALSSSETTPAQLCSPQDYNLTLPDIESSVSLATAASNVSVEYYTPPTTPQIMREQSSVQVQLLKEIRHGFHLRHISNDPEV